MKLNELVGKANSNWCVHFEEMTGEPSAYYPPTFYATVNIKELYKDWMSDCYSCPENGSYIYNIILGDDDGRTYLIESGYEFTFEELMRFIEGCGGDKW